MVPLINVKYVDVGTATGTTKEVVVGYTGLINLVGGLCARIDEMTMSNTRQVEVLSKRINDLAQKMEDLTGRLGHLSEETIRRKLAESKGVKWCQALRVTSMNEIMEWVDAGIGVKEGAKLQATEKIIRFLIKGFTGLEVWNDETVPWEDLDIYSQLVRYLYKARMVMGKTHGYFGTANRLWNMYQYHRSALTSANNQEVLNGLVRRLRFHDSAFAFALLWMRLHPAEYRPQIDVPFAKWNWPQVDLEFDYIGTFQKIESGWIYQGAETKFSVTTTKEAAIQLERRIKIVDFVVTVGFEASCSYVVSVFVPTLGESGIKTEQRCTIEVLRKRVLTDDDIAFNSMIEKLGKWILPMSTVIPIRKKILCGGGKVFHTC